MPASWRRRELVHLRARSTRGTRYPRRSLRTGRPLSKGCQDAATLHINVATVAPQDPWDLRGHHDQEDLLDPEIQFVGLLSRH